MFTVQNEYIIPTQYTLYEPKEIEQKESHPQVGRNGSHFDIVNHPISPKKDWGSIPVSKIDQVLSTYTLLSMKYSYLFPFFYDEGTNTVYFLTQFSLSGLVTFIKDRIAIGNEIEMDVKGADFDVWIQSASLEKVEDVVTEFLLYTIPAIEHIVFEDLPSFRFLIRELAFKNLNTSSCQKTIIGFSNANGHDCNITFLTNKYVL